MPPWLDLLLNALVTGVLLGGFYAAITLGISIAFGLLDLVNIAHPAFVVAGAFLVYLLNAHLGLDPLLAALLLSPLAFVAGAALYYGYYAAFERRGDEAVRGLAFFFGIMFIVEVLLVVLFGVDYRSVETAYGDASVSIGPVGAPVRLIIAFVVALALVALIQHFLTRTFLGRQVSAVSQDRFALQLMGVKPERVKAIGFGISVALAVVAGALLIVIQPVEPSSGRHFIGTVFAICVLGGLGSIPGTLVAALLIAVAESLTSTFWGPSWSPVVSFGALLLVIGLRPQGLFGR